MDGISPILIANRGEIAVRVARTARALGLATAGVRVADDTGSVHGDVIDCTVSITSYLDPRELLRAATLTGARSVHPGYGFLSENAAFARMVIERGLVWIGPDPDTIELMGDKRRAREAAQAAGVPVVPAGEDGPYPLIVKAVAGGGGKGMRVVRAPEELADARAAAAREALAAFGDDELIVERYLDHARHIEIQVLGDRHGTVVHFGERECSLQRRHQKVVEEAPSPAVDAALRSRIGAAAVALATRSGYVGAGTVEFIATAGAQEFFFLEMNTRLQVEHPVTELVYGVDLVEQQLRVAAGERLSVHQEELVPHGHAIEARLYAEDPAAGFLPATGTIERYREPALEGVRVDSGVSAGSEVGTAYDAMLAKVVAHGPDRASARRRLDRALRDFDLLGVATNAAFTRSLLDHDAVRSGELDTGLLERVLDSWDPTPPADLLPAAAVIAAGTASPDGPWRREVAEHGELRVSGGTVTAAGHAWEGAGLRWGPDGSARVRLDGVERRYLAHVSAESILIARDGYELDLRTRVVAGRDEGELVDSLLAPMPGTVLLVHVADGDEVDKGDPLIVLESMKMELAVTAPHAGVVADMHLRVGDRVTQREPLLSVHGSDTR